MARETFNIPLLNGGIRNDVMSQLIQPNEAWLALNEDSMIVEGAVSKRRGRTTVTTFSYPVRCIFEGEMWDRKRVVVAGGQIYEFTPPSTFTEIYSEFDGEYYDVVKVTPYRDEVLGRILIFCDGVNHPMYWDGVNPMQYLPNNAPIAKCGIWHRTYFIFGNLKEGEKSVFDSGDLSITSYMWATDYKYSAASEINLHGPCGGELLSIIIETTETAYTVYVFDEEPRMLPAFNIQGSSTPTYTQCNLVGTTNEVYNSGEVSTYQHLTPNVDFHTKSGKIYLMIMSSGANGARTYTARVLLKRYLVSSAFGASIKWCDTKDINEWTSSPITSANRLSIETSGGGDIIAMLPLDLDTFVVYKDDGSIISVYATGSSDIIFGHKTISEGYNFVSGNAIISAEGSHWAFTKGGFVNVSGNSAQLIEPYGKVKEIFNRYTDDWKNAVATYDEKNRRILVALPRTGGTTNDGVLVFNIKNGTYDLWDGSYSMLCYISNASDITIGSLVGTYVADYGGYTVDDARLKRVETQLFTGSSTGVIYRFPYTLRSDDSTAISSYRESGFIRPDPKYDGNCWFRAITLEIDLLGDYNIVLEYRSDYDESWKAVPVVNTSKGVTNKQTKLIKRYINTTGRAIKVKWSNAEAFNTYCIRSMYIEYEKMDEAKD